MIYEATGSSSNRTGNVTLYEGDILMFVYSKDGSVSGGTDRATVSNILVDGKAFSYDGNTLTRAHKVSNNSSYPFRCNDSNLLVPTNGGISNSTSSFTLYVNTNATVTFEYKVSSEINYDYFKVIRNGSNEEVAIAGNQSSYESKSISLSAGEYLVFQYSKDSSQNVNDDCVYVRNLRVNGAVVSLQDTDYTMSAPVSTAEYGFAQLFGRENLSNTYSVYANGINYYIPNTLKTVEINGTGIGGGYFKGATSIENFIICRSVTNVTSTAFSGITNATIYCEATSVPSTWSSGWNNGLEYLLGYID